MAFLSSKMEAKVIILVTLAVGAHAMCVQVYDI